MPSTVLEAGDIGVNKADYGTGLKQLTYSKESRKTKSTHSMPEILCTRKAV